ncbi:C-factor [Escovopsis weberi]|uniref:C-factor n=1 Tax=Escovopsis weberi TaxID=150374 RepID=A0A0M9VSX8_ESCWE|nr:C-factor [Escovopsis weberi]
MSTPWIFVCPSSRGIGFALTRHLLARTPPSVPILATTRHPSPSATKAELLRDLDQDQGRGPQLARRLTVVRCDVADEQSVAAAAREAERLFPRGSHHLHLAAAIPGVLLNPEKSPLQIDADAALRSFQINTVGPLLLAKHFFDFLPRRATVMQRPAADADADAIPGPESEAFSTAAPPEEHGQDRNDRNDQARRAQLPRHTTWLTMAARVGSTTDNHSGGWFSYRASKAGVASLTRSLDVMLQARAGRNAMAVAYHPGTVMTDLSRDFWRSVPDEKLLTPEFAAGRMLDVVCGLELGQRGRCWAWDGEEVPP